jgi:hypothetical protein
VSDADQEFRDIRAKTLMDHDPVFFMLSIADPKAAKAVIDGEASFSSYLGVPIVDYSKPTSFAKSNS